MCAVFVARDLSGFTTARKGAGNGPGRSAAGVHQMGFAALLDRHERGEPNQVEKPMRWSSSRLHASPFFESAIVLAAND
jgi:hypothetical protein